MTKLISILIVSIIASATANATNLDTCESAMSAGALRVYDFFQHDVPAGFSRQFSSKSSYNDSQLSPGKNSLALGVKDHFKISRDLKLYTLRGDLVKYTAGQVLEIEPTTKLVVDYASASLRETSGVLFIPTLAGLGIRAVNRLFGHNTPAFAADLTNNLTDRALDEAVEIEVVVKAGTNLRVFEDVDQKRVLEDGSISFLMLTAPMKVKNGGLVRAQLWWSVTEEEQTIAKENIVSVTAIRFPSSSRDYFEGLQQRDSTAQIKVGETVAFHLARRMFSDPKFNAFRADLFGKDYPRGTVVRVTGDRYIIRSQSGYFQAIPKELVLDVRTDSQLAQEPNYAVGTFQSHRFDDRFSDRSNVFLIDDKGGLGLGLIYSLGQIEKSGSKLNFTTLGVKIEQGSVIDRGCEFVPSTHSTVWGYQDPSYNDRVTYRQPGGGGG